MSQEPQIGWSIACASCGYHPITGHCVMCEHEICEHCRHDTLTGHCDGCGCDVASLAVVAARNAELPTEDFSPWAGVDE